MDSPPVILITGASSGIGAASARLFASKGYRTVLAARRMDRLEALATEITTKGRETLPISTDVTQPDQIENLVAQTMQTYGQVDVLLNNAGLGRMGALVGLDAEKDIHLQLSVNLSGAIYVAQAVLPHMLQRGSGQIINMASISSFIATPNYSIYAATKFGMRGFTQALRRELAPQGIVVSGIYPGGVATEFSAHTGLKSDRKMRTPAAILLSADDVAQTVWRVVQHPRRTVIIPRLMRLAVWLNRLLPGLADQIIRMGSN